MKNKKAFTLTEVLITLGIIGVVAALTIPTLVKKYQQHVAVTQLKKAYTELNQAIKFAEAEYGDIDNWDWNLNDNDFFNIYFSRYIKIKETRAIKESVEYYRLSGNREGNYSTLANPYIVITNSGYGIVFKSKKDKYFNILIDINALNKPNTLGKDLFSFTLLKNKKAILPHAWDDYKYDNPIKDRNILKNGPSYDSYNCNKKSRGMWCAALIMFDDWKISDDYPW